MTTSGLIGREAQGASKTYTPTRNDIIRDVVVTTLRTPVLGITATGKLAKITAAEVPEIGGRTRGKAGSEVLGTDRGDSIVAIFGPEGDPMLLVSAQGMTKRLDRSTVKDLRAGRPVMKLVSTDRIVAAFPVTEKQEVTFVSSDAQSLRTPASGISIQGPAAKGVAGIKLKGKAKVVGAGVATKASIIVSVTDRGTAKATATEEVPSKGRGGSGVRITKFKDEDRIEFAWIGEPDRTMCVVGQQDAPSKPDLSLIHI